MKAIAPLPAAAALLSDCCVAGGLGANQSERSFTVSAGLSLDLEAMRDSRIHVAYAPSGVRPKGTSYLDGNSAGPAQIGVSTPLGAGQVGNDAPIRRLTTIDVDVNLPVGGQQEGLLTRQPPLLARSFVGVGHQLRFGNDRFGGSRVGLSVGAEVYATGDSNVDTRASLLGAIKAYVIVSPLQVLGSS